jgi:hypothetical protein
MKSPALRSSLEDHADQSEDSSGGLTSLDFSWPDSAVARGLLHIGRAFALPTWLRCHYLRIALVVRGLVERSSQISGRARRQGIRSDDETVAVGSLVDELDGILAEQAGCEARRRERQPGVRSLPPCSNDRVL